MKMETNKEKMDGGKLFTPYDPELAVINRRCRELLDAINNTASYDFETRSKLAKELFGSSGVGVEINKNIHVDYGVNIHVGDNFYANYGLTILDICEVRIGKNALLGPNVHIYAVNHPLDPKVRKTKLEIGMPVTIGDDAWIGGNVTINPGVKLGNNVIVASGAVVTKSFGDNVVIGGNPAKIIREITSEDTKYWQDLEANYYQTIKR